MPCTAIFFDKYVVNAYTAWVMFSSLIPARPYVVQSYCRLYLLCHHGTYTDICNNNPVS